MAEMRVTLPPFRGRVMIVNDILYIRNQIRQILLGAGVRNIVEPEPGGDAFVTMCKNPEGFSLVIDDYESNPSGIFLLKVLRSEPRTPEILRNIPFIMLMSNAEPQTVSEVMAAGASGILLKPFNGITLLKTVKRVLEKAGAGD
jgi:two-component system chemotaxis response regulator CheY